MYAEAAAAGVRAVVASTPAWARALVDRQTIPATVVDAGRVPSKPTFRNCQEYTPGEVSEARNQSPLVTTVEEPPGGVIVPAVVAIT
jgi:hypothetical protein